MPSVCGASDIANWGIIARWPSLLGTCSWWEGSGTSYSHFPWVWFHLGRIMYQKHFSGTSAPPMAQSSAAQVCSDCCILLSTMLLFWLPAVMHRSMLSTNPNPTIVHSWWERAHMTSARNPSSASIWNKRVLTTTQIWGLVPLPWPIPVMGASHSLHPWDVMELPYVNWTWCCILWSSLIIHWTDALSAPNLHRHNAVMMSMILCWNPRWSLWQQSGWALWT